jgi:pimeloyl-ACP methyl ester carboxylesterase
VTLDLVPGASRHHVAVDGMRFSLWRTEQETRSADHPAQTPVMLLHGVPQTAAMWRDLVAELRSDRVVLAPDLPGLGSSELRGPYDMSTVAAGIAALAMHEVEGPIDAVGHDWGGVVALALAASRADLVRRVVVLNTAYRSLDLRAAWHVPVALLPGLPELAFRLAGPSLVPRLIEHAWCSHRPMADDLLADYQAAYADPRRIAAMLGYYRDNFRPYVAATVKTRLASHLPVRSAADPRGERCFPIPRVPALVVWGARDPVLPDSVRASLVRDLADCRCVVIPDAGHFVLEEAPETAIPAIASFLHRTDGEVGRS